MRNRLARGVLLTAYYGAAQFLPQQGRPGGEVARAIRAMLCRALFDASGRWIKVGPRVDIGKGHVSLGQRSSIGMGSRVPRGVKIGEDVMIGPELLVVPTNHPVGLTGQRWIEDDGGYRPPQIGDGAWIGARVILLPGVTIGRGCIIGAGAVVTKDIPDHAVAVGVPAKVIRYWNSEDEASSVPAATEPDDNEAGRPG